MNSSNSKYALMVLKPDALRQVLDVNILNDLENRGIKVVKRKIAQLNESQAGELYAEKREYNYFPLLKEYMASGQSLCLILQSDDGDIAQKAKEYRDWARRNLKLIRFELNDEDVRLLSEGKHPKQEEITREMALENLIHVSDDFNEDVEVLGELFTKWDIDELKDRDPELHRLLSQAKEGEKRSPEIEIGTKPPETD